MWQFFHGWRRKAGVVALVMAIWFVECWVRGHAVKDVIQFGNGSGVVFDSIILSRHGLMWVRYESLDLSAFGWTPGWSVVPIEQAPSLHSGESRIVYNTKWRWSWFGFDFCDASNADSRSFHRNIPYWSVTIPLTFLSACLILWKPRQQKTSSQLANSNINSN
jgi:hypothetical protein